MPHCYHCVSFISFISLLLFTALVIFTDFEILKYVSYYSFIIYVYSVDADNSLQLTVHFPADGSFDVRYGETGSVGMGEESVDGPLPRVVGWETNERYVLHLSMDCGLSYRVNGRD